MKKASGKNIFRHFQTKSVEAVRLVDIGYSPRGGDGDFSFSIQK